MHQLPNNTASTRNDTLSLRVDILALRVNIGLLPHQREALHRWASRHCAQAVLLDGDPTVAILLGLRDTARTSASHARTLRAALHQMAATPTLKGRWCTLVSAAEVLSCVLAEESARRSLGRNAQAHAASTDLPDDDEERVVTLR